MDYPDLEVSLFRQEAGVYAVDLRLAEPDSEADRRLNGTAPIRFDYEALRKAGQDPAAYGTLLAGTLLAEDAVRSFFAEAIAAAEANDAPLAVRLAINPNAVELHSLRWETLQLPNGSAPLLTGENLRFSRYLSSLDWRPVRLRPQSDLRALVAVASPSNAARWQLAEVKTAEELAAVRAGLGSIAITELATRGQVTLNNLAARLRDGCDILYLVAHGILVDGEPQILLEQEDGTGQWTAGRELVTRINELQERPRLVVLVSCQSAGTSAEPTTQDDGALAGLGPRLAEVGVPAVIAMQGNLTMKTAGAFMSTFFAELQRDSQVDRAIAVARGAVRDRPDWWMPVLYMRLRSGRIGSTPGSGEVQIQQAPPIEIPAPPEPARPPEPGGFVGRQQELSYFADQLHTTGMAIICGMAGAGKTALASVLVRRVAAPDRVFWHSFHAEEGFRSIVWHLAGFLAHHGKDELWRMLQSTRQTGGQPPPDEMLFDYAFQLLRGQGYLLCLDDLQFVDEEPLFAEQVKRLLQLLAAGELALIVTSARVPRFVSSTEVNALEGLGEADTRALLTARGLALDNALVAELQRQTSGNAQLLTLAVDAISHSRNPAQLIARLPEADDIDRYLMGEVDQALTSEERTVMEAVAILLGHFGTRDAIETIAGGGSVARPLRDLGSRYLLIVRETEAGRVYGLHAMLQAFYYDLLGQRERTAMHLRAGEHYASLEPDVLQAARHYQRAGETARAAVLATQDVWSIINQGQAQSLQQLLDSIPPERLDDVLARARIYLARGQTYALLGDGEAARKNFDSALQVSATLTSTDEVRILRAQVYEALGRQLEQESPQQAMACLQRGLEELGGIDGPAKAALHIRIGSVHIAVGDYQDALTVLEQGLKMLPDGPSQLRASALLNLGSVHYTQGDTQQGTDYTLQALAISRDLHDLFGELAIENNLSIDREIEGDWQGAVAGYKEALTLARQLGSAVDRVRLENSLGTIYIKMGDDAQAEAHLVGAIEAARRYKNREDLAYCLTTLADLRLRQGALAAVEPLLAEAEQLVTELDLGMLAAELFGLRGQLDLLCGRPSAALANAKRAVASARELEQVHEEGRFLRVLAGAQAANRQSKQAEKSYKQSLDLLADHDPYEAACTKLAWGNLLIGAGNKEKGEALQQEAAATFRQLGAERELAGLGFVEPPPPKS